MKFCTQRINKARILNMASLMPDAGRLMRRAAFAMEIVPALTICPSSLSDNRNYSSKSNSNRRRRHKIWRKIVMRPLIYMAHINLCALNFWRRIKYLASNPKNFTSKDAISGQNARRRLIP